MKLRVRRFAFERKDGSLCLLDEGSLFLMVFLFATCWESWPGTMRKGLSKVKPGMMFVFYCWLVVVIEIEDNQGVFVVKL
jgi:hypothetical protein